MEEGLSDQGGAPFFPCFAHARLCYLLYAHPPNQTTTHKARIVHYSESFRQKMPEMRFSADPQETGVSRAFLSMFSF